jgi:MFS family permease
MTAVAQWFRKNVGKAMGIVACGFGAGGILIPPIVWFIDLFGWRTALIILGLGMWALGIPLSTIGRNNMATRLMEKFRLSRVPVMEAGT